MKKKHSLFLSILILLSTAYFVLPGYIQDQAETQLSNFNYKNPIIGSTDISFNKIVFKNITLKRGHSIKEMTVTGSPLSLLGFSNVETVHINGLNFNENASHILNTLRENKELQFSSPLPANKITISNSFIHFPLKSEKLSIGLSGNLTKNTENKNTDISLKLNSESETVKFDVLIEGTRNDQKEISINAAINSLNLSYKLASIYRATGWLNITQSKGKKLSITGQLDAGSGNITGIPTKNISAIIGNENQNYALILRAHASGTDGVTLLSDISYGGSSSDIDMQTTLNIKNMKSFTGYLEKLKIKTNNMSSFQNMKEANIEIKYLPERRFIDGPLPFDVTAKDESTNILNGTFLIYPKDMEIRGSAQTNSLYTNGIKELFSIADKKASGETLRLDGSIKDLF